MTFNLATATFAGTIERITPANKNYQGDPDDRPYIIWLKVVLSKKVGAVMVRFTTNQGPIPYLIRNDRIQVGHDISVMGQITSLGDPQPMTAGAKVIHLSNPMVPELDLYTRRTTTVQSTAPYKQGTVVVA